MENEGGKTELNRRKAERCIGVGSDFVQFFLVAYLGKDDSALGGIYIYPDGGKA
jgi:hypothetical protein